MNEQKTRQKAHQRLNNIYLLRLETCFYFFNIHPAFIFQFFFHKKLLCTKVDLKNCKKLLCKINKISNKTNNDMFMNNLKIFRILLR